MASAIIIPLFILIILPSFYYISVPFFINYLQIEVNYTAGFYSELVIILIILIYSLLPATLSAKKHFKIRTFEKYVIEFGFLKKSMYIGIPLLIAIYTYVGVYSAPYNPENPDYSYTLLGGLLLIVGSTFLRIISNISQTNFRFYYARGCFHLMSKETDETNKMNYFIMALNSYNKYLKRNLKLHISNINNIYSKIISDSIVDKYELIKSISTAFESNDKLKPIKYISAFLDAKNTEQFLTKEPLGDKIKEWGTFLAVIIPIMISIIQLLKAS